MRNLLISALMGILFLLTGCGVVHQIAADTCSNGNYNTIVCPGMIDNFLPKQEEAVKTTPISTCSSKGKKVNGAVLIKQEGSNGPSQCNKDRKVLEQKLFSMPEDTECTLKNGSLQCASSAGIALAAFLMFILGRIRPQLRMTIGGACFILGALVQSGYASTPCHEALQGAIYANIKSPSAFIHIASKCHIQYDVKLESLRSQTYGIEATIPMVEAIVDNYCSKLSGKNIATCSKESRLLLKKLDELQLEASNIWIKKYEASLEAREKEEREAKFKKDLMELKTELQKIEEAEAALNGLKERVKQN